VSRPEPISLPSGDAPKPAGRPFFARATGRAFQARTHDGATVIDLFDEIGTFGVSAGDFQSRLREVDGDVVLRLNSPGGSVFDGIAIFNALVSHPGNVRVEIVGLAASAASLVAMAGDAIAIAENAFLMVHRAWAGTIGNEADHDEAATVLRQIDGSMATTYASRTGKPLAKIKALMEAETWLNADAAIAAGFATERLDAGPAKAKFDLSVYAKAPAELVAEIDRGNPSIRDLESILRDAGCSRSQAKALAAHGHHGDAEQQREAAELAELAAHISAAAQSIQI
jgi:ATP-dependent protease ClpP protease subunit